MPKLIVTEQSFLETHVFEHPELLELCIQDVESKLLERPEIFVYGKVCRQPRDVAFFQDGVDAPGYKYSGRTMPAQPLTTPLLQLLELINAKFEAGYNGILVNRYLNGHKYISAHSDDEAGLDQTGVVALSHGATRNFRIRNKADKTIVMNVPLVSGELVQMGGKFQSEFTHEIPKQTKITDTRYSFTFRTHRGM
jgi:alkylated DNA repair dioxygenase AlkB